MNLDDLIAILWATPIIDPTHAVVAIDEHGWSSPRYHNTYQALRAVIRERQRILYDPQYTSTP